MMRRVNVIHATFQASYHAPQHGSEDVMIVAGSGISLFSAVRARIWIMQAASNPYMLANISAIVLPNVNKP
jgi:hypothetical protein